METSAVQFRSRLRQIKRALSRCFRIVRSEIHNRYIRMHANGNMDVSDTKGKHELPSGWTWERFTPVDAGNGEWALWSRKSTCADWGHESIVRTAIEVYTLSVVMPLRSCLIFVRVDRTLMSLEAVQAAVKAECEGCDAFCKSRELHLDPSLTGVSTTTASCACIRTGIWMAAAARARMNCQAGGRGSGSTSRRPLALTVTTQVSG